MDKCPKCGKEIAKGVEFCSHCGTKMEKKTWYSMQAQNGSGEITIYDEIGMFGVTAKEFKASLDAMGDIRNIKLKINSPGGDVIDGFAIYNLLRQHAAFKDVEIDGYAASIASVVAMAGNKISMPDNTFLFIHNPYTYTVGDSESLRKDAELLDKMKNNAIRAYQTHAKDLSDKELSELMDDESWLTAEDAKTYGLIDEIMQPIEAKNSIQKGKLKVPENVIKSLTEKKQTPVIKNQLPALGNNNPEKGKGVSMDKCPKCGKEVTAGAVFCNHCGASMKAVDPAITAAHQKEVKEAVEAAALAATNRVKEISARCKKFNLPEDFQTQLIDSADTLDACIVKILDKVAEGVKDPVAVHVGADDADKFRLMAGNSLYVALGKEKDKEVLTAVRKNPGPRDLHSLTRACLVREGRLGRDQIDRLTPQELASHAIRMSGMGSSDLPSILADTMNKEFLGGFNEAPSTFQEICAETENPNFMTKTMTKISGFSDIDEIPEGMDFKQGKFSDKKETIALSTKGKALTLSRQLLVNNDTSVISTFPRAMSTAMKRKMNVDFYDLLTYNTLVGPLTGEDGVAFFNYTSHNNLKATSGVPSVSAIGTAEGMLMGQPLPKASADAAQTYVQCPGTILLTGTTNMLTTRQVLGSQNDPAATNGKMVFNPYYNAIRPVFDAYLQAKATAASKTYLWYLLAGPSVFRNWVVAYLAGNRTPTLRSEPSGVGDALGISYDIFFDYKFGFEDYRGIILNDGA